MVTHENRFQPPVNGGQHIRRRNLLQQLQRLGPRRLTTIIAPAGYGKTSFAAQWYDLLKNHGGNLVWLPLETDDCDQSHFLVALLEALQDLQPGGGRGLDEEGRSPDRRMDEGGARASELSDSRRVDIVSRQGLQ